MNWADMFDGGTLMAVEVAGTVLLFLACVCACGVVLLALYFAGKLLQALQRFAVRQLRAKALLSPLFLCLLLFGCSRSYSTDATVIAKSWETSFFAGEGTDPIYSLMVRFGDGKVRVFFVTSDVWFHVKVGQHVRIAGSTGERPVIVPLQEP